jgi:hypothetical protein
VERRRYEFRVSGLLSERTRGAFPDMTVVDAPPETIILGDVLDESHLHGVHVVSVHQIPGVPGEGPGRSGSPGGQ